MTNVDRLITDYIDRVRGSAERELRYFKVLRTLEDAVSTAALAELPSGKRHPHQRRIPRASLERSRERLAENLDLVRSAASFAHLIHTVNVLIRPISKIGELAVYDTSLRIGAHLALEPEKVYIHAGTRDGAAALGFDRRRKTIEQSELPAPFGRLAPREIEDFLCRYKKQLR